MTEGRTPANENTPEGGNGQGWRQPCNDNGPSFADDLLRGADEIAAFLFGDKSYRRRVFHLVATSKIPVFRIGSMICARKSTLMAWIAGQEGSHR